MIFSNDKTKFIADLNEIFSVENAVIKRLHRRIAEGEEVIHYEVLSAITSGVKNKKFATKVKAILAEEKRHLQLCTRLAKEIAAASSA